MEEKPEEEARRRRKKAMTPELRRFLGPARSLHDRPETEEEKTEESESPEIEEQTAAELEPVKRSPRPGPLDRQCRSPLPSSCRV